MSNDMKLIMEAWRQTKRSLSESKFGSTRQGKQCRCGTKGCGGCWDPSAAAVEEHVDDGPISDDPVEEEVDPDWNAAGMQDPDEPSPEDQDMNDQARNRKESKEDRAHLMKASEMNRKATAMNAMDNAKNARMIKKQGEQIASIIKAIGQLRKK